MLVQKKNGKPFTNVNVCLAAIIANLTATAATCVMSWSSPALPMITNPGSKILITKEQGAFLSSIAALGACFGPFITGRLTDSFGRKITLLGAMVLLIATWIVFYICDILAILLCARFLAGVCAGCVYGTLPMYISEISPVDLRGPLGSFLQFFDCIGYLVENIGGSYVSYENLALLSASLPLLCFITFVWIPESPYYLQNRGKEKEALEALRFFRDNIEISELNQEIEEMKSSAKIIEENYSSLWLLFKTRSNLKSLYYAAALIFFQQTTGINVITFYCKTIFIDSGSTVSADASAIILNIVMMLTSLVTITASRFFKMRTLLMFSSVGVVISMFVLASFFFAKEAHLGLYSYDWIPLVSLIMYISTFTLGHGPLVWCITSVIFPAHLKAIACSLCASFMWFLTFILTSTFESINPAIGFFVFGCSTFISCFFIRYHLPETKGKTFQEIQDLIQEKQCKERDQCTAF